MGTQKSSDTVSKCRTANILIWDKNDLIPNNSVSLALRVDIRWSSVNNMGHILLRCLLTFESKFSACIEDWNGTARDWQNGFSLRTSSQDDKMNKVSL
jgi:hypothetical protein